MRYRNRPTSSWSKSLSDACRRCGILEFTPTVPCGSVRGGRLVGKSGQVGEWLKPTDCKSVTPCELRRFESFPVHQFLLLRTSFHRLKPVPPVAQTLVCVARGRCSSAGRARPW